MTRTIISIDEAKCNGCGLCAAACHEGAIGIVAGKAKLLRADFCDGLGDCLPACPTHAISFSEQEISANLASTVPIARESQPPISPSTPEASLPAPSCLANFPVQLKLVPPDAPYFDGADLLIAADCTAYAYGNFHHDFMREKVTLIACPKLDAVDYAEKLTQIFQHNAIRSITVTRMTVPCCGGLPHAVETAIQASSKPIPLHIITIRPNGQLLP